VALWFTYDVAILFEPTIYRLIAAGSGKKLHGFVVRILTAARVLVVRAFQNKIING
jgi:hypothetical protein